MKKYEEDINDELNIEDLDDVKETADDKPISGEELYEEEYFREESKKGYIIRLVAVLAVFFLSIIIILVFLNIKKNVKNDGNDLQNNIIDYAKEESGLPTPEPTQEPVSTPEPDAEPMQSPEISSDIIQTDNTESENDDNAFAVHGMPMENGKKDYTKVKFDTKSNLKEMEGYFVSNHNDAIKDLAYLDRFIAMSYSLNLSNEDCYYYGDVDSEGRPDGKGIAVYSDNRYYYGDFVHGQRSGSGKWIHFHIHDASDNKDKLIYHEYQGEFKNDKPNGQGQDHYEYKLDLLSPNKNYVTNYLCSFRDGLIDGDVYCTSTDKEGTYLDWEGKAVNGSFEYISESRDNLKRGPVMTDRENPDNYMWIAEKDNNNIGVISYD